MPVVSRIYCQAGTRFCCTPVVRVGIVHLWHGMQVEVVVLLEYLDTGDILLTHCRSRCAPFSFAWWLLLRHVPSVSSQHSFEPYSLRLVADVGGFIVYILPALALSIEQAMVGRKTRLALCSKVIQD